MYLREEVVQYMGTNIMMNLVEDAIVPINGGQTTPQVAPLLHSPRHLFSTNLQQYTQTGDETCDWQDAVSEFL